MKTTKRAVLKKVTLLGLGLSLAFAGNALADRKEKEKDTPKNVKMATAWLTGDFHQHTLYTDGSTTFDFVMEKNNAYGLDWWTNSEHGGSRNRDGNGNYWDDPLIYPVNPILGDPAYSGGHQVMWRWQSLRDFAFPDILRNRALYSDKQIISGLEWNVPGHEHCSTGIVADDASAVSAFEYQFDASDRDTSREGESTPYGNLEKQNVAHADAVAGCAWMQEQYEDGTIDEGYIVFAHPERRGTAATGGYDVNDFRDLNNAGPDVCFGFEGAPGHQVNSSRGGFGSSAFGGTYGGAGYYTAKVGGLWDAMLGEGRHWFNFANSDYHKHYTVGGDDFYPGEYQKTYINARDTDGDGEFSKAEVVQALRSGNAFHVMGDLIDALQFDAQSSRRKVAMGETLQVKNGEDVKIKIKFKSPTVNQNGDTPAVDHIDLIAGDITGMIEPGTPAYTDPTNPTTRVIATFNASNWKECDIDEDGYTTMVFKLKNVEKSMYFRLRGSNVPPCSEYETDCDGNPLADSLATEFLGLDGAEEAYADLWFYSNPIFVEVGK